MLLSAMLLLTGLPAGAAAPALTDMSAHWARTQVESGVAAGYVSGYPDGTFRPNATITRAEFMKLLGAAMKLPASDVVTDFTEEREANRHWSFVQGHIQAAVENGLLVPSDYENTYAPDTRITRREIVIASVKALGKGPTVGQTRATLTAPDAPSYPEWLQDHAVIAVGEGIIRGYEDGSLGLERNATRAEALVMVQRILAKVTAELAAASGPSSPTTVRHPGEGEPYWSWTATSGRPTISNGTAAEAFTFAEDVSDLELRPAPGRAAWLRYSSGGAGVVARLRQGKLTEVVRYSGRTPTLLAVDDGGQAWLTNGSGNLLIADRAGAVSPVDGVSEELRFGAFDWSGIFWAVGAGRIYRITPEGDVMPYETELAGNQPIQHMELADDGALWLFLGRAPGAATGPKVEAVKLEYGKVVHRVPLLNRVAGGVAGRPEVRVVGRSGPFLWVTATAPAGVFRFSMATGEFTRLLLPGQVPSGAVPVPAPDGGAWLADEAGKFWRLIP